MKLTEFIVTCQTTFIDFSYRIDSFEVIIAYIS